MSEHEGGTKNEPTESNILRRLPLFSDRLSIFIFVRFYFFDKQELIFLASNFTGGAAMRVKITLACTECKHRNYDTTKNKKNDPDRLEMQKYCKFCRKHTLHKETK